MQESVSLPLESYPRLVVGQAYYRQHQFYHLFYHLVAVGFLLVVVLSLADVFRVFRNKMGRKQMYKIHSVRKGTRLEMEVYRVAKNGKEKLLGKHTTQATGNYGCRS